MDAVWFVVGADSNRLHIIFPWLGGNISMIFERLLQRSMGVELTPDQVAERIDGSYHANSGAAVTEETAWGQSTVYACVRILSESIAMLPIRLVRRQGGRTEEVENHAALDVLYNPNGWQTPHEYMQQWVSTTELRGNFNSLKTRNGRGQVVALLPLLAQQVSVEQRDDWSLVYQVSSGRETQGTYNQNEMLHARGMSSDGYRGMSTIGLHREAIGLALQTEKHGAVLFKNGAQMGKVFHTDGTLSDGAYDRLKRDINNKYEGVKNAHRSMILEEGLKVESIAMTNEDSQFLETRRFQKQEIAAIFGVPMFLLNDTEKATTWGSGLEQISKAFVTYTLKPRLQRIQQTLGRELLSRTERRTLSFSFDTDEFNLASLKERYEAYRAGIETGIINPNEGREMESMNPREGGEEYRLPANINRENDTDESDA